MEGEFLALDQLTIYIHKDGSNKFDIYQNGYPVIEEASLPNFVKMIRYNCSEEHHE